MSQTQQRQRLRDMNAWDRHKQLMAEYQEYYGGELPPQPRTVKTDLDSLAEQHRFIRRPEDDQAGSWEVQLARRYYAKLFKEYAIVDLTRYKEGLYGMRWRSKQEVLDGKGQFICGTKGCEVKQGLCSFEVPFAYVEADARRDALVKVRLCPKHALQLNYRKNKEVLKLQRIEHKRQQKRQRKQDRKRRKHAERQGDEQLAAESNSDSEGEEAAKEDAEADSGEEHARQTVSAEGLQTCQSTGQPGLRGQEGGTGGRQIDARGGRHAPGRDRLPAADVSPEIIDDSALLKDMLM